jgi:hypothetical protein
MDIPTLSGYWKGLKDTKPVGNIGKDLPGFKLPLTGTEVLTDISKSSSPKISWLTMLK